MGGGDNQNHWDCILIQKEEVHNNVPWSMGERMKVQTLVEILITFKVQTLVMAQYCL